MDGGWMASVLGSSSSSGPPLIRAPREAWPETGWAPAPSPLLKGGETLRVPSAIPAAEDGIGRALELAHQRSVVRHKLFQEAMGAMTGSAENSWM